MFNESPTLTAILFLFFVGVVGGCAAVPQNGGEESISVVGEVTVRGQEPFAEYVLVTEGGNFYVLEFPDEAAASFSTPAQLRVRGRLFTATWDGRPYAHIEVGEWERAP